MKENMTTVEINNKSIYVHGHSGYAAIGSDIVCAAISTLVQATYNYLESTGNQVHNYIDDGEFTIILDKVNKTGNIIINRFIDMVQDISEQYPKYIEMRNEK